MQYVGSIWLLFLLSIVANRHGNMVMFYERGGVEVGDIDSKAHTVEVDIEASITEEQAHLLVSGLAPEKQK